MSGRVKTTTVVSVHPSVTVWAELPEWFVGARVFHQSYLGGVGPRSLGDLCATVLEARWVGNYKVEVGLGWMPGFGVYASYLARGLAGLSALVEPGRKRVTIEIVRAFVPRDSWDAVRPNTKLLARVAPHEPDWTAA